MKFVPAIENLDIENKPQFHSPSCLGKTNGGRIAIELLRLKSLHHSVLGHTGGAEARGSRGVAHPQRHDPLAAVRVDVLHQQAEDAFDGNARSRLHFVVRVPTLHFSRPLFYPASISLSFSSVFSRFSRSGFYEEAGREG